MGKEHWGKSKYQFLLMLIILIGVTFNILHLSALPGINHDESYTVIRSVGKGDAYRNVVENSISPVMMEVKNAVWLEFMRLNSFSNFRRDFININKDRAGNTNPPFTNILLNLWMRLFGSSLFMIKLFNIFIYTISVLIIYCITGELLEYRTKMLVTLIYSISYVQLLVVGEIRGYALFGLLNLLVFYSAIRIIKSKFSNNEFWWLLFVVVSIAGFLTHYTYLLVFMPITFCLFQEVLKEKNKKQLLIFLLSMAFITIGIIPHFIYFFSHIDETKSIIESDGWLGGRYAIAALNWEYIGSLSGILRESIFLLPWVINILIAGTITFSCVYGILKIESIQIKKLMLFLFFSTSIGYILLYKIEMFPTFTIGPKYQVAFFPYYLLSIIYLFRTFSRKWIFWGMAFLLIGFVVAGDARTYLKTINNMDRTISYSTVQKKIPKADIVILDSTIEGMVGPVINSFPDNQSILVGTQKELAINDRVFQIVFGKKSVIYVNALKYYHNDKIRDRIIAQIKEGLGDKRTSDIINPFISLESKGCGKGYNIYVFQKN